MFERLMTNLDFWAIVGFAAQAFFTGRFAVQWIASERQKKSVIPIAFWYLSIVGSVGLLAYSVARADPVFILGYTFNNVVYIRNLVFVYRERRLAAAKVTP
jgi:lipid-A-disaccharide synthase-like uncharacterized protein